jgi:succinate dehydrogenase hydrophobic anchor subunit
VTEDYVQSHWGRLLLHGLIIVAGAVLFFVGMLNVVQAAMLKIS